MIYLVTVLWFQICSRSCQALAIITSSLSCSPRYFIFKQDHLRSRSFAVEFKDHLRSGIICGATRGSFKIAMLHWMLYVSLACVTSETNNLQRVFRPGGSPLYRLYGQVRRQRVCFFQPFWSVIEYGLCTLVLNWVCFLEELATYSSFGDKIISLSVFTPITTLRAPGLQF